MEKNIYIFPSAEDTASALADYLVKEINKKLARSSSCTVALSGGNTPKSLFRVLAGKYSGSVNWSDVSFFWVDERCVPPDDPDSNYGMTMDSFLGKIDIPSSCIHRIIGENDPDLEANRYAGEIINNVLPANGIPSFDIILLGMGDDGHTASIFQGSENLFYTDTICASAIHPVSGQKRVTLTGKVINNASIVVVFVTGRSKSKVIGEVIGSSGQRREFPVSLVAPINGILLWYIDSEAGIFLSVNKE
jgi:6-phosphogluconolactonase